MYNVILKWYEINIPSDSVCMLQAGIKNLIFKYSLRLYIQNSEIVLYRIRSVLLS